MLPRHSEKSSHSEPREHFLKGKPRYPQLHVCTALSTMSPLAQLYLLQFMTRYESRKIEITTKEEVGAC